jgi:hypothetical protein
VVDHLPCKSEVLNSNPSTAKKMKIKHRWMGVTMRCKLCSYASVSGLGALPELMPVCSLIRELARRELSVCVPSKGVKDMGL